MKVIDLNLRERGYKIYVERGAIGKAAELFKLNRKVMIITDDGVPCDYAEKVKSQCKDATVFTVPTGEESKSLGMVERICRAMLELEMTRSDCVVAVGGGVVGDLAGFVASTYMRGVDFYNIPTTLLAQVDSSIGGKTAVNLGGVKNIVGAFYQPGGVIIDPDLLSTLPERQIKNGLAEAIKMSLTSDKELFELIESGNVTDNIEEIIYRSLLIKRAVVEADEREGGVRKILNLGHTLGHAIEAAEELGGLYHGECVAIGMTVVCAPDVKGRLITLLKRVGLPYGYSRVEAAIGYLGSDKKRSGDAIDVVYVDEVGSYRIEKTAIDSFGEIIRKEILR